MASIEDNAQNRTWWYKQLKNMSQDWNSMLIEERSELVTKLQQAILDLTTLNIPRNDLKELIIANDVPTVWDAVLALQDLTDRNKKTHWELLAYLKKTITGMWKDQYPSRKRSWQLPPTKDDVKKRAPPASWECVDRNDPSNFNKHYCQFCRRKIRSNNRTGICIKCQKKGHGKNSEY